MKFLRKSLLAQLVTYFVLLSVMILSLVGYIAFVQARNSLKQAVFEQLESSATLKDDELVRWVGDQRETVLLVASLPEAQIQAKKLLKPKNSSEYQAAYTVLSNYMDKVISRDQDIQNLFIIRVSDGQALISTDDTLEGTLHTDAEYFIRGQWGPSIQSISVSPDTGNPTMTIATPLLNEVGLQLGGVLVAQLNLDRMDKIILKQAGLGESGQTYLVDKSNALVSSKNINEQEYPQGVSSEGINAAIQGVDGTGLYTNYAGVPVIGAYRWIGQWEVALLVEIDQQEALAPAARLAQVTLLIGLLSVIVITASIYILSRQITRPILSIAEAALRVSKGDYDHVVEVVREDEVGVLARAFNDMTTQLRETLEGLEERVADRTRALAASTEVSRRLSTILDQDTLVKEVVEQLVSTLGYYYAHIYLFEEDENTLVMKGGTGEAGQVLLSRGHTIPKGRGLVGRAAERNEVVLVGDTLNEEGWLPNELLPETRAEVAVPISIGGIVLGVFDVQHNVVGGITEEDAELLQSIANQVAIAVQNTQVYVEAQRRADHESLISTISQKIQNATTIEDTLQVAIRELGLALNAEQSTVQLSMESYSNNDSRLPHEEA